MSGNFPLWSLQIYFRFIPPLSTYSASKEDREHATFLFQWKYVKL